MKAKELAALLMETPEEDVYIETFRSDSYGDWYYDASTISSIEKTPSGLFFKNSPVGYERQQELKTPDNKPLIGSSRIKLLCYDPEFPEIYPEYLPCNPKYSNKSDLETGQFWEELQESGYYYSYLEYADSVYFVYNSDTDAIYENHTIYEVSDVEYVEVLTSLDENTWDETWVRMSFEEAYEFFKDRN